jgi:hypothetical protein
VSFMPHAFNQKEHPFSQCEHFNQVEPFENPWFLVVLLPNKTQTWMYMLFCDT